MLKKSGRRRYTITIGVVGADNHVGVTHLTIMLANYLASKERCKVAVMDCSAHNSMRVLQAIHDGHETVPEGILYERMFRMYKVDYYSQVTQRDIANILHLGYEYIITDFGKVLPEQYSYEILRCNKRILVGSCCEWEQAQFCRVLEHHKLEQESGNWSYGTFHGIDEIRHSMEKRYGITVHKIPYVEDPFCLSRIHFEPLQNMLQEEMICL